MSKLRVRNFFWLTLLAFGLRGLVPAGYMLDATDHGFSIVVCDSGIFKDALPMHGHHAHHGNGASTQHSHSTCPFALAAMGATSGVVPGIHAATFAIGRIRFEYEDPAVLSGPIRAQQSRGPPSLS